MSLRIAVPRESDARERRVAIDPGVAARLHESHGVEWTLEAGCGLGAGFADARYEHCLIAADYESAVREADLVIKVNPPTLAEVRDLPTGCALICQMVPYLHLEEISQLAQRGISTLAMDQMPRISRAQPMDVLSSQATVGGYKAALLAAELSPRLFPMLTTAAGTIKPARVVVIGAGVAGMQAIATARRLGAQVQAYDVRRAAREQIESLGATMIDTGIDVEGTRGVARALTGDEKSRQQKVLTRHLAQADVVICAAAIPGRHAPRILTAEMVNTMAGNTVIVDMAAETGGNCELTRPGETVYHAGVRIVGPINLPSSGAVNASEMYARNCLAFLHLLLVDGALVIDRQDEIIADCLLTHEGLVCHQATAEALGLTAGADNPLVRRSPDMPDRIAGWIVEPDAPVPAPGKPATVRTASVDSRASKDGAAVDSPVPDATAAARISTPSSGMAGGTAGAADPAPVTPQDDAAEPPTDAPQEMARAAAQIPDDEDGDEPHELDALADDLTRVDGIGPALQRQLNAFGIRQFEQLAELDDDGAERLEQQLILAGHILRDNWPGQARMLVADREAEALEGLDDPPDEPADGLPDSRTDKGDARSGGQA